MNLLLILMAFVFQAEELKEIKPSEAKDFIDKKVVVVMEVQGANFMKDKDICFLNSLKNHRDEKNFTVVLRKEGLASFAENKVEDPAKHLLNKMVKVTGKIADYKGKLQIVIEKFEQIKVNGVKPKEKDESEGKGPGDLSDENQSIRQFK